MIKGPSRKRARTASAASIDKSLFELIPSDPLQAILHSLEPQDHAHLRQVSHATRCHTTPFVPCISLLLSESSSTDQLQQWETATMQMQHVPSVHVHIAGKVQPDMFNSAMQLLSQRPAVKELRLLPARLPPANCVITSLQPIAQLASQLETLVIEGVSVGSWVPYRDQLAAAEAIGWQLHKLVLNATLLGAMTDGLQCFNAIKQLPSAFPALRQLTMTLPPLVVFSSMPAATGRYKSFSQEWLAQFTLVAAVSNAVLQLSKLEKFSVRGVPDMWRYEEEIRSIGIEEATGNSGAHVHGVLDGDLLPSVSAAAAAFSTLAEFGRWLLQHHSVLRTVQITTEQPGAWGSSWTMSWGRVAPRSLSLTSIGNSTTAVSSSYAAQAQHNSNIWWSVDVAHLYAFCDLKRSMLELEPDTSSIDLWQMWTYSLHHDIALYSSCPPSNLMHHIVSCHLSFVEAYDVDQFAGVLGDFECLQHLQLEFDKTVDRDPGKHREEADLEYRKARLKAAPKAGTTLSAAVAAAATVQGLLTLECTVGDGVYVPLDMLSPLTVSGSSPRLRKLALHFEFYTGMPSVLATTDSSAALVWDEQLASSVIQRPSLSTLVQRVKDLQIAPASVIDPIISNLVRYGLSSHHGTIGDMSEISAHVLPEAVAPAVDNGCSVDDNNISDSDNVEDGSSSEDTSSREDNISTKYSSSSSSEDNSRSSEDSGTIEDSDSSVVLTPSLLANRWLKPQQSQQQHLSGVGFYANKPSTEVLAAAAVCLGNGWHNALHRFNNLQCLHLNHDAAGGCMDLLVECLPPGLKVLSGKKLKISSLFTAAAAPAASIGMHDRAAAVPKQLPELQELALESCLLSSPSVCASDQLQKLALKNVQWAGGWSAAAAAWPNVVELQYEYHTSQISGSKFDDREPMDWTLTVHNIAVGFKHLRVLELSQVPWDCLSCDVLQPLVQHVRSLKHLDMGFSRSGGQHTIAVKQWLLQHLPWASIL